MSRRIIWMVAVVVTIVSCANFKIEKDLKSFMKSVNGYAICCQGKAI